MGHMKTTLVISDIQHPFHDQLVLDKLIKLAAKVQPDAILQIGDGIDFPTVSRWTVGTAAAYVPELQEHIDGYRQGVLERLSEAAPGAQKTWLAGNHDERLMDFIGKYAPALAPLRALSMESLFELDRLGWKYEKGPIRVATNTYAIHGHESGGYCASQSAWDAKFAKRYGSDKSFVFGHTHQPFLLTRAYGFDGKLTPRFTMNVGSIMDPVQATYIKDGSLSWTMGFGVLRDDGKRVWPELITLTDRKFYFEGERF